MRSSPASWFVVPRSVTVGHILLTHIIQTLGRELEAIVAQHPPLSLSAMPSNSEIRHIVRNMATLSMVGDRAAIPLLLSQKATQLLYKTQSSLGRELFAALLTQLCEQYEDVRREVITWLVESPDEVLIAFLSLITNE
jgi:CCR4-NOT transcription complex subunit 1